MDIKPKIAELEDRLQSYLSEMRYSCLEYTAYIIEVGALTVGTDDTGNIILQNKSFPMQFSEEGVKTVLSLTFRNGNNEIEFPKVYGKNEWYSEQVNHLKMTLVELENIL